MTEIYYNNANKGFKTKILKMSEFHASILSVLTLGSRGSEHCDVEHSLCD